MRPRRSKALSAGKTKTLRPVKFNPIRVYIAEHDFSYLVTQVGGKRAMKFVNSMKYGATVVYSLIGVKAINVFEKKLPQLREILSRHGYTAEGIPTTGVNESQLQNDLLALYEKTK
jgi:hypothetical protein